MSVNAAAPQSLSHRSFTDGIVISRNEIVREQRDRQRSRCANVNIPELCYIVRGDREYWTQISVTETRIKISWHQDCSGLLV